MPGSIAENIRVGTRLSDSDLWAAATAAGVADDIAHMPMGMNTVIVGQAALSGGQRQRILMARALARKPAMLILDEATSALDNETQSTVMRSIERLGITRIVIAHRLSTLRQADRIVVLQAGTVVEQGTVSSLISDGGVFATMVQRQLV